jgi:aminoglycoside phosphotransferase family enzyme/predicted kinase
MPTGEQSSRLADTAEASQDALIEFLSAARSFGAPDGAVERITTHAAVVFLVGERAYKMKRAVRYSFLDFTTLDRRRRALEAELELNRRTAPMLYRRLVPVTREDGDSLALAGSGEPVEWLLEMARFDQEARLDRIAQRGELTPALVDELAAEIAAFHERAAARPEDGGAAGMREVIEGNAEDFAALPNTVLPSDQRARLTDRCRDELDRRRQLLEERRRAGRVRRCHGDLHLGNIVLLEGRPVLFDCLEFDEALASTDTLYDLAFLLMDLQHQRLAALAQRLLNGYLDATRDDAGLALLPLFLACRAAIRGKVLGLAAAAADDGSAVQLADEACAYLERAFVYLNPPPARLVAIGGVSGTGKSTLARQLAPGLGAAPGAVILRSDVIRKQMYGIALDERLPAEGYQKEVSGRVYGALMERAAALVGAGHAAIVDAVFLDPAERAQIEQVAADAGVTFQGLWLTAPQHVLMRRVRARRGDASDATPDVLTQQLATDPGVLTWPTVDVDGPPEIVAARACELLSARTMSDRPAARDALRGSGGNRRPT